MSNLNLYREATRHPFTAVERSLYGYQKLQREVEEYEQDSFDRQHEDNEGIRGH